MTLNERKQNMIYTKHVHAYEDVMKITSQGAKLACYQAENVRSCMNQTQGYVLATPTNHSEGLNECRMLLMTNAKNLCAYLPPDLTTRHSHCLQTCVHTYAKGDCCNFII